MSKRVIMLVILLVGTALMVLSSLNLEPDPTELMPRKGAYTLRCVPIEPAQ